jgi:CIC family chloride channel protein
VLYACEDGFERLPIHWMWWPALGGLVVGLGGLIEPRALGVGYDVIGDLLNGDLMPQSVLLIFCRQGDRSGSWRWRPAPRAACWRRC